MMRPSQEAALVALAERFADLRFAIGGSALLALLGADVEPGDIDVVVDAQSLEQVQALAGDWWRGLAAVDPHPHIDSAWLAALEIEGEPVEVMGGLTLINGDLRWELLARDGGVVEIAGCAVPLAPVGQWVALYTLLEPSRAMELAAYLGADEIKETTRELPTGFGIQWPPGNVVV